MGDPGCGRRPAAEEMVMMLPAFRSFMPGRMLLMVRNVVVRLPSSDACHPSRLVSSRGPGFVKLPPAFATAADALDETIDLLFALTSFQTFDLIAGPKRTPADVAPIVLRAARALLDLPV